MRDVLGIAVAIMIAGLSQMNAAVVPMVGHGDDYCGAHCGRCGH